MLTFLDSPFVVLIAQCAVFRALAVARGSLLYGNSLGYSAILVLCHVPFFFCTRIVDSTVSTMSSITRMQKQGLRVDCVVHT